jgi:hypothetical protein
MSAIRKLLWSSVAAVALLSGRVSPALAQGHPKYKHYVVSSERAISVTRRVLIHQGYTVVRVHRVGPTHVVYYRRGDMGRGKGKGPVQRMVIRTVRDRVTFEETEPSVLVDIDIKLKL